MTSTNLHRSSSLELVSNEREWYQRGKRILDVMISIFSLPLLLVIMAAIALAIILDSRGSPLFVQVRVGKGGNQFKMYKFRTMRRDYDNQKDRDFFQAYVGGNIDGNQVNQDKLFKPVKMEHITRTGRILRKTSLDELPQIINILKGEMSLVGPRPNLPWEVEKYKDWHCERLNALPGITGLAQVRGRSSLPFDQIVQYDIEYIQKQSFRLDLQILWQTVVMVLTSRGAG